MPQPTTNNLEEWEEEMKKVQSLLDKESNLDKISFYEGYIKGLQFIKQLRQKDCEELINIINEDKFKETRKFKMAVEKYLDIKYVTEEKISNGVTEEKFEGYRKIKKTK